MNQPPRRRELSSLESPQPSCVCSLHAAAGAAARRWSALGWAAFFGVLTVLGSACSDTSGDVSSEDGGSIGGTGTGGTLGPETSIVGGNAPVGGNASLGGSPSEAGGPGSGGVPDVIASGGAISSGGSIRRK